jgi:hypothetical protein
LPNGKVQLVGADYLVFADAWHAKNQGSPQLMGQLIPDRCPNCTKNISCDAFRGKKN